jgi:hypothetical protein
MKNAGLTRTRSAFFKIRLSHYGTTCVQRTWSARAFHALRRIVRSTEACLTLDGNGSMLRQFKRVALPLVYLSNGYPLSPPGLSLLRLLSLPFITGVSVDRIAS